MIFELREMNDSLANFKFPEDKDYTEKFEELNNSILRLTTKIDKIKLDKVEVTNIDKARSDKITLPDYPTEMRISNLEEIKQPEITIKKVEVNIPDKFEISNLEEIKFPEIKTETVKFPEEFRISNLKDIKQPIIETKEIKFPEKLKIDWENAPKIKEKVIDILSPIKTLQNGIQQVLTPFLSKISLFIDQMLQYIKDPDRIIVTGNEITEWYGKKKITYAIKDDGIKMEIIKE